MKDTPRLVAMRVVSPRPAPSWSGWAMDLLCFVVGFLLLTALLLA